MNEVEELHLRVAQLEKENLQLMKRILQLEQRLAAYENANTPSSKQRFRKQEGGGSSGRIGRPPGAEGSTRPVPEPDETVEVTEQKCPSCNRLLGKPVFFETKVIEEIPEPQPVRVTEYRIAHYNCPCGEHVVAKHPGCPRQGRFGPNLQAEVALLKVKDRLPLRKIQQVLYRRYRLTITPATIFEIEGRVRSALLPEFERLKARIRNARVVYCDETTFRVNGKDWWLWVFRTDSDVLLILRSSRSGEVAEEILGEDFERVIVSDGYSVYSKLGLQQRCWAHLIRELKFIAENDRRFMPFLEDLREFFHKLKEKVGAGPPQWKRNRIFLEAKEWLEGFLDTARSWKELRKFANYLENGMPNWLTFVMHDGVEPTNNAAERALREHVVVRKIIGTLRNRKGAEIYEVLASVLATWEMRRLDARAALVAAVRG
jgi:transposase